MIWTSAEVSVKEIEAGGYTGLYPRKIPSGSSGGNDLQDLNTLLVELHQRNSSLLMKTSA